MKMYKEKFIQEISELVVKYPSSFFNSVSIAQACLETGFGTSVIYREANNAFGYKAKAGEWDGSTYSIESPEEENGRTVLVRSRFRRYDSVEDSVKDHANMMTRSEVYEEIYQSAIQADTPEEQAKALSGTYATDSRYGQKLIQIMDDYDLRQYDKGENMKPKMIDRRKRALGYPGHGAYAKRSISAIKQIVRHYTAVNRRGGESNTIKAHENYWRNHHGWDIGGYGIYIDFDGNIYWNYDFEIVTYGAGRLNPQLFHICLEGSSLANHSAKQLKALDDVMAWLLTGPLKHLGGNDIRGHWEIPYNSTSCPGMTKAQLDAYRVKISKMIEQDWTGETSQPDEITVSKSGKYTVKHGDTLWAIGQAHDVSVKDLQQWNGIAPGQWLKTDQVLYVVEPKQNAYTVVKGDYLWKIAQEFGVTVDELKEWNELETNFIYVGQELFVKDPELEDMEEPPVSDEMPVPEEQVPDQPEDKGDETPAVELKENQYLRWDGVIIETKVVE